MPEQEPSVMAEQQREADGNDREVMPGPEELIRSLELQSQEHYDAWLRAKAETDNVRKRAEVDVANAHRYGLEQFASQLLPVKDSLEAALTADNATVEALRLGVELTLKQLNAALEKNAIREINPAGEKFDPHKHEAITTVESERPANSVVNVLQKGYQLNDRILRPALVTVAKAKPA